MSVKMIAAAVQRYDGKLLRSGDRFEVGSEAEAADLVALHFATRDLAAVEKPEVLGAGCYSRRDMVATEAAPSSSGTSGRGRRSSARGTRRSTARG